MCASVSRFRHLLSCRETSGARALPWLRERPMCGAAPRCCCCCCAPTLPARSDDDDDDDDDDSPAAAGGSRDSLLLPSDEAVGTLDSESRSRPCRLSRQSSACSPISLSRFSSSARRCDALCGVPCPGFSSLSSCAWICCSARPGDSSGDGSAATVGTLLAPAPGPDPAFLFSRRGAGGIFLTRVFSFLSEKDRHCSPTRRCHWL